MIKLKISAKTAFYLTSYLPLFLILIIKQIGNNANFLNWGGFNLQAIVVFVSKFGLSVILLLFSFYGIIGMYLTLKNVDRKAENNSLPVTIENINNISGESINYIVMYIIPFIFNDFNIINSISIILLLLMIYSIYIRSNLIAVNPVLSMRYSISEVTIIQNEVHRKVILISRFDELKEGQSINVYEFTHNIFYYYWRKNVRKNQRNH